MEEDNLSIKRKCELLSLNRSGLYYEKKSVPNKDVDLMNEIRDIHEQFPALGHRKIHVMLRRSGHKHNRKKTQRIMRLAKIRAIYPEKRTTIPNKNHKVYKYLLKGIPIVRPNQAWQVDITYIKIKGGFVYLTCLIDIYSRRIMGWNLSTFLDTKSCVDALENALFIANPEIINSDQGCQFTSDDWCNTLINNGIFISMDGKGRWADNIYVERLWRTIKYECINLYRFDTVADAQNEIALFINFYNKIRPHQALKYQTPEEAYREFYLKLSLDKEIGLPIPLLGFMGNSEILAKELS